MALWGSFDLELTCEAVAYFDEDLESIDVKALLFFYFSHLSIS